MPSQFDASLCTAWDYSSLCTDPKVQSISPGVKKIVIDFNGLLLQEGFATSLSEARVAQLPVSEGMGQLQSVSW